VADVDALTAYYSFIPHSNTVTPSLETHHHYGVSRVLDFSFFFFLFSLHIVGIYLFTCCFLLSRLSLSTLASYTDSISLCTLLTRKRHPHHRFSPLRFLFSHPPQPHSLYYRNSCPFLKNSLPNDHTTHFSSILMPILWQPHCSVSRLSSPTLPTFVDIGYNFGGASIEEGSVIQQLQQANKTVRLP